MDILLYIYALGVFGGMMAGIEDESTGGFYILCVLLWPLTLIFIIVNLIFNLL